MQQLVSVVDLEGSSRVSKLGVLKRIVIRLPQSCNRRRCGHGPSSSSKRKVIRVLAAVVHRNGKYLICQRPLNKRHGGLWEFPGGKIESGETNLDAAQRELQEELSVSVTGVRAVLFSSQDPGSEFVID